MNSKILNSKYILSLGLFLLALLPRLFSLGSFLTADEFLWVDRSRNFLAGLTNAAYQCDTVVEKWEMAQGLACTLRTGHPGVTTMWTGSFGLWLKWLTSGQAVSLHDYVVAVSTNPLDAAFIAPERLGTVLLTAAWVVAVYWLARRLFGGQIALVGAVLLALDPFHIALSRVIHHDALSTLFMTLSALTALIYWGQGSGRRWLFASGVLGGLGFISKSPAMYLMPFIAVVGLWFTLAHLRAQRRETAAPASTLAFYLTPLLRTILDGLLWFGVSVATVFLVWPAMWVVPLETIETVFFIGSKYATGGHAKGNYFLGEISKDPGPLFYPVTWLYRASPLVVVGVGAILAAGLSGLRRRTKAPWLAGLLRYLPLILIFILGYYLLMTIGEKKQDRYFLPVYPWLDFIAAAGLIALTNSLTPRLTARWPALSARSARLAVTVVAILMVNGYLVASHFPYYFTYYNPLFGGIQTAGRFLTVGWGEGLDQAAVYLNRKSQSEPPAVASWYQSTFAPFYQGRAISYSEEKGKALAGDYVIFYINQLQRQFPDEVMFDYFTSRAEPEQVIELHGQPYVWIYPSLGVDHYVADQTYSSIASLLAWQWIEGDRPLRPGQPAEFDLYWEYLGKEQDEPFFLRLVDAQNRTWAEGLSRPVAADNPPRDQWRLGEIIHERGALTPPPGMPPGQYRLRIGFYTEAPAVTAGQLRFQLPSDEALVRVAPAPAEPFSLPPDAIPYQQPLSDSLTLLGADWPQEPVAPGEWLELEFYWRVERPLPGDSYLHIGLMNEAGEAQQAWFNPALAETFDRAEVTWPPGQIIHTRWRLDLQPDTPPGQYQFELVWPDDVSLTLPFGSLRVEPATSPAQTAEPDN